LIDRSDIPNVLSWLPWDRLKTLFVCTNREFSIKIFHFMSKIVRFSPGLPFFDHTILPTLIHLSRSRIVWEDILELLQSSFEAIPGLLALVWSVSVSLFYSNCFARSKYDPTKIPDDLYGTALLICTEKSRLILESQLCVDILTLWIPSLLVYPFRLADAILYSSNTESSFNDFVVPSKHSLFREIGRILEDHGFQTPSNGLNIRMASTWLSTSTFSVFLSELFAVSSEKGLFEKLFASIVLCRPLCKPEKLKPIAIPLFQCIANRLVYDLKPKFPFAQFLQFAQFLAFHNICQDDPVNFLSAITTTVYGPIKDSLKVFGAEILGIIIHLLKTSDEIFFPLLVEHIVMNPDFLKLCFVKGNSYKSALFYEIWKHPESAGFLSLIAPKKSNFSKFESQWISKNQQFEKELKKFTEEIEFRDRSIKHRFSSISTIFSHYLEQGKQSFNNCPNHSAVFSHLLARIFWRQLISSFHRSPSLKPKSHRLCPRVLPFRPHRLLSQSPFSTFSEVYSVYTTFTHSVFQLSVPSL
jgi:hypothetical protein